METYKKTKEKVRIDFDGRKHPFHPEVEETAGTLKAEAIAFFGFVGDPNTPLEAAGRQVPTTERR